MGAVYESESTRGEGKRAIKMLHPEFVHEDQILQRFFTEAAACKALQHPNIAAVYESARAEDGSPYLVMELLQGIPLAAYMEQGRAIPPAQAAPIVYGMLQALGVAHGQRIVHRDLKPDNLFLVRDARGTFQVKVLDFGIAKVMDVAGGMGAKTRTGVLLGTPGYMSPEQIKNAKGVDARSDLWSVGVIFYEMLTATTPFNAENEFARLTSVLTQEVKPIEQVRPELAAWSPFFLRALMKDPNQRFQNAEEMARAIMQIARGGTLSSAPASAVAPPSEWQAVQLAQPTMDRTNPSAPALPTQSSGQRPPGAPTVSSPAPSIAVVSAPPLKKGAPWWLVGLVAVVCLGIGFAAGFFVGG
jgi:serine/threonine-protein kinase